ncbi:hypothetical protein ccbrp13_03180 [Ktedonobacteria bacterium brp13]|nr:hypothetical protein ccbrp13_03180 [Ktedonobacteria bacterium brp13]
MSEHGEQNEQSKQNDNYNYNAAWFEKLDAIVTGESTPTAEDDELLHLAAKLSDALTPLSHSTTASEQDLRAAYTHQHIYNGIPGQPRRKSWLYGITTLVAVLFVFFTMVAACPASPQISVATLNAGKQLWQDATSFEQIDASSVALLSVKNAGVRPLLPQKLPVGTQAIEFGIITDTANAQMLIAFAADYRIAGQDISIYEQPANLVFPSSVARHIAIGTNQGQLFQNNAGNSVIQWYQDGMTCQIASVLPLNELLAIAHQFHTLTNWDLIA